MMPTKLQASGTTKGAAQRYRLPGIAREGIAQLSLLETALWPLQGGRLPGNTFETKFAFSTSAGRKTAHVTVRAPCGLQPTDEFVLWGLLGATLARREDEPVLLATPYWMLRHLGLATGGFQYAELRASLLRLALASYQNDAFYNPETQEHEYAAFQFLSILLPTVGGVGESVDNDRCWRIEWNAPFFRFCRATGGNLLFDIDLYRKLTPSARRLFLKLKDRFWRSKRVFFNIDDLTVNGLGFSAARPLYKRKFDLLNCIRELLCHDVLTLGRGQTDPRELFLRRRKGCYVVSCYEGPYFQQKPAERATGQKNAISDHPLYEPLMKIGVDGPAIRRLFQQHGQHLIQRWVRITDAAMHEKPRGFAGFRVSPAAFLIDGIQNRRTPPDWHFAHEKRQEGLLWERNRAAAGANQSSLRALYGEQRRHALKAFLASDEGRRHYADAFAPFLDLYRATEPERAAEAAREAAIARIQRMHFHFPDFEVWALQHQEQAA